MRQTALLILRVIVMSFLGMPAVNAKEPFPKLYNYTCEEYWNYHNASSKPDAMAQYFSDLVELWDYSLELFQEQHPDLNLNPEIFKKSSEFNDRYAPPLNIMVIYQSCPTVGHLRNKKLGESLQGTMLSAANFERRKTEAEDRGCSITRHASLGGIVNGKPSSVLSCEAKHGSVPRTIVFKDEHGSPIAIQQCTTFKGEDRCVTMEPNKEGLCLSEFGDGVKSSDGSCGWAQTKESELCAELDIIE